MFFCVIAFIKNIPRLPEGRHARLILTEALRQNHMDEEDEEDIKIKRISLNELPKGT